jgi:hypothetical protein
MPFYLRLFGEIQCSPNPDMDRHRKLYQFIMLKKGDANVSFSAICNLLQHLGFDERIRGDHHIFYRLDIEEIINLQPIGNKAKAYQIKQIRELFFRYNISL